MNAPRVVEYPRQSIATLTHLRDFAGFVEGTATWDFDEYLAKEQRDRERKRLRERRLLDML